MNTRTYTVEGMTCQHCVQSVTGEISKLAGIDTVKVDLAAKTVTVTAESIDGDAIRVAIDEAGYAVVSES